MRNRFATLLTVSLVVCSLGWTQVAAVDASRGAPHRYNPRSLDGPLVQLANPIDGRTWSAWSYRDGAEYDIAISYLDGSGFWSEPSFLGRQDRRDQVQPTMIVDGSGHVYLAFADRAAGSVMLSVLAAGTDTWSEPLAVSDPGTRAFMPALSIVGTRLVIAYRSGTSIEIRDLPLLSTVFTGQGITDGPDPFGTTYDASGGGQGGGSDGGNGLPTPPTRWSGGTKK